MTHQSNGFPHSPRLPRPLALPLRLLPAAAHSGVLARILNRLFSEELAEGELDFLEDKVMAVRVADAGLTYRLTLAKGVLKAAGRDAEDLSIEGSIYDFLLLASRREDADTLFFNRRLRLGGNTELGLYVKNFLDAVELEERLGPLLKLLDGTVDGIDRIASLGKFSLPGRARNV